ncbi:TPA: hypothetical protein N0F65_012594 [Lagenidium giganteum]|uniref:Uncharacterized protein n=1 Tax=Lagenidium giganteum TaxID=4803 RepID=A0AAV2YMI0_9STRA|nr:TPA: hypothetical protein N0F65_012594 [Lagenidium giganteum]
MLAPITTAREHVAATQPRALHTAALWRRRHCPPHHAAPFSMQPPPHPGAVEGDAPSSYGTIVFRGWLNLKTRSMVNVRPRHMRYCVLSKEAQVLSTFKFQPSSSDLKSAAVKPLKAYKALGVAPWSGRRFGFLLSATQLGDNGDRMLECDAPTESAATDWIDALRALINDPENAPAAAPQTSPQAALGHGSGSGSSSSSTASTASTTSPTDALTTKESSLWIKGASVHRGLLNDAGENNCFLNVVIQSFWHLTSMRHYLLHVEIKDGSRTVEANVLRALKSIMTEYDDTTSGKIHSRALRKGLSVLYAADKNFQVGAMYDAEETLLALLNLMHQTTDVTEIRETRRTSMMVRSLVRVVSNEMYVETPQAVFDENSIPHLVFSHQIYDRYICNMCHHSTPWDLYSNLVYTTYASDLCATRYDSMEQMLRTISHQGADIASGCDEPNCRGQNMKERVIRRFPMVFAISILWATNAAAKEQVLALFANLSERVDLAQAFNADGPASRYKNGGIRTTYRMRGFVCYYGRHYVALFYSTAHKSWLLFDDSRVLEIGQWEKVVAECLKGRFQPVLVFYELPDTRKDSSVSLFNISESGTTVPRRKSSSMSSAQGDMPPSIQEEGDEMSPRVPGSSAPPPFPTVMEEVVHTNVVVDVETNREFEMSELARKDSNSQNISPVSPAIAMCPRTLAMNSPLGEDEYDVRFGEDSVLLGMYLERIDKDLCVTSFPRALNGDMFGAEKSGQISLFDTVLQANGHPLHHYQVDRALKMIKAQSRPLIIRFRRSQRVAQLMDMGFSKEIAIEALQQCRGVVQAAANKCFELRSSGTG